MSLKAFYGKNILFFQLTGRIESFVNIIPVPIIVYFLIVTGALQNEKQIWALALAGFIASMFGSTWGILDRWFNIKNIFQEYRRLQNTSGNEIQNRLALRNKLLAYPYREGLIINLRWLVGICVGLIIYSLQIGQIQWRVTGITFYSLIYTLPISYVMHMFITESVLRPLLRDNLFTDLPPESGNIRETSYFVRIILSVFSVTITPIAIFGFLLYSTVTGKNSFLHPEIHIIILAIATLSAIIIVSYRIAKSIKNSISETNDVLQQLGKGNFSITSTRTTSDEFGRQSELLADVAKDLQGMYTEIRELNENLERKVELRTAELNMTLDEVRLLKHHQDGDYFLTTLLLRPLNANSVQSKNVSVEIFMRQKKQFEFKGISHDLGGDLCCAHEVQIRDRSYVAFLNADAMGKSMQGAGGALVMGSVFFSIVERTVSVPAMNQIPPERWLKNAFLELDKVFDSFDGSMLVSLVIGLVDTQTGLLYYINAEHPWSILRRDEDLSFIENEHYLHKLGMSVEGKICVRTFEMMPGDEIICGSDGRDDILISSSNAQSKMNEDVNMILSIMKKAQGDLRQTYEICAQYGEITDDFSLIKIQYNGQVLPLAEQRALRNASKIAYQQKKYPEAIEIGEQYLSYRPGDSEFMQFLSRCYRHSGNYNKAIDYAERLRLRLSGDLRNLSNLAAMHILRGDKPRANKMITEIKINNPAYPTLKKLEEIMHSRMKN